MLARRQPISFLAIAMAIRQDEVVAQIYRVTRPGNEMIDVDVGGRERTTAIETISVLEIHQDRAHYGKTGSLTAEQEFIQVGGLAENIEILLANVAHPCAAHEIRNHGMKLAQAGGNVWPKLDCPSCFGIL